METHFGITKEHLELHSKHLFVSTVAATLLFLISPVVAPAQSTTTTLDFSNFGSNVPGSLSTIANGSIVIDGVDFQVPNDDRIFVFGPDSQPFINKSLNLWTYGPQGLIITFPEPIIALSFETGEISNEPGGQAVDEFLVEGLMPFDFMLSHDVLQTIDVQFPMPVDSVQILFQSGAESLLGMDTLTYAVPEPDGRIIISAVALLGLQRRIRRFPLC